VQPGAVVLEPAITDHKYLDSLALLVLQQAAQLELQLALVQLPLVQFLTESSLRLLDLYKFQG
jgi:hypothetical protein